MARAEEAGSRRWSGSCEGPGEGSDAASVLSPVEGQRVNWEWQDRIPPFGSPLGCWVGNGSEEWVEGEAKEGLPWPAAVQPTPSSLTGAKPRPPFQSLSVPSWGSRLSKQDINRFGAERNQTGSVRLHPEGPLVRSRLGSQCVRGSAARRENPRTRRGLCSSTRSPGVRGTQSPVLGQHDASWGGSVPAFSGR